MAASPIAILDDGILITIRVTPNAAKSAFAGAVTLPDGRIALAVRVAAPPVEGAANVALIAFLAKQLGVAKRQVAIVSGETSRLKAIRVRGDPRPIADRVGEALSSRSDSGRRIG